MTKQTKWSIDQSHTEISFKVRHLMIAHVKGGFQHFDASIYTNENDFSTAIIDLWIEAASINTRDEKRDEHLRSADFLDATNHKQITFTSETIGKPDQDGNSILWGELTIRGITKNIQLNVKFGGIVNDPWGNEKAGFTVTGTVNRSDWDLTWNATLESGGFMVSDEVEILCEVELKNDGLSEMNLIPETETAHN